MVIRIQLGEFIKHTIFFNWIRADCRGRKDNQMENME